MRQKIHQPEAVTGYDLCSIQTRQAYEKVLNSHIFPRLSCYVDLTPHSDTSNLRACCYQNSRITLYVPMKLSFTIDQMIAAIYSAYESDTPCLVDQIIALEKDPDEITRLKKRLNGKAYD